MSSGKTDAEALALRARPKAVTRLNRRLLIVVVSGVAGLVLGATLWSLRKEVRFKEPVIELHNVDRIARAEGLEQLPLDYSKMPVPMAAQAPVSSVPVLGEPLPGDLGTSILRAERASASSQSPTAESGPANTNIDGEREERLRRLREIEDAIKAPLFFRTGEHKEIVAATAVASAAHNPTDPVGALDHAKAAASSGSGENQSGQSEKREFVSRSADTKVVSEHALQLPVSPYRVMAGTVIAAALITGINSDLPGMVLATVTEPVYDTTLGRYLLIPQGTRLIGEYDSQVAVGQRRVLLVWSRMILPDGSSITLDRLSGVDPAGNAGLADGVDRHWSQLMATAALSTLIGIGAELAAPDRASANQVIVSARQSTQDSINQVGQELTRRNANAQPTLTVRPGYPLRVLVSRDLVLRLYPSSVQSSIDGAPIP